ncbi:MAG: cytochrome c biogenesis protein ResB [Pseudomonadota bacterium]
MTQQTANGHFPREQIYRIRAGVWHALVRMGSLRLTLWLFILFALCIAGYYFGGQQHNGLIITPLLLLSLNLLATIATHTTFRRQVPLLVFHLALLGMLLLLVLGRLTYLKGEAEVTSGSDFEGLLNSIDAGPLHHWPGSKLHFHLTDFSIDYAPGVQRDATRAQVSWQDSVGNTHQGIVGDQLPLVLDNYRFYTTHNKGFAALFQWHPQGAMAQAGSIHFPSYPANEYKQAQSWVLPGTRHEVWSQLDFDELILDPQNTSQFRPPVEHQLILRSGSERHLLRPGQTLQLAQGRLHYQGLGTWMGFRVFYDWTLPWLLATVLLAVLSLGWHYWVKAAARPWLNDEELS